VSIFQLEPDEGKPVFTWPVTIDEGNRFNIYPVDNTIPITIWLRFGYIDDDWHMSVAYDEDAVDIGIAPDWTNEILESGWDSILDFEWGQYTKDDIREDAVAWGLENGIAPDQNFCIKLWPPRVVSCGTHDYGEEYDIEWDWKLVGVAPHPDIVQSWLGVLAVYQEQHAHSESKKSKGRLLTSLAMTSVETQLSCGLILMGWA
jgi:hypothetical protein